MIKTHKISYWAFMFLIICSLVVFGLFFFAGYDNPVGKLNAPEHTDTLIYLMYAMTVICIVATIVGALWNTISSLGGPKGDNKTGVPMTAVSVVSVVILVGSLVVAYAMSSTDALVMSNGSVFDKASHLVMTDTFLYSIYALTTITILALVVNLTGIFRR